MQKLSPLFSSFTTTLARLLRVTIPRVVLVATAALAATAPDAAAADPAAGENAVVARFAIGNGPDQIGLIADIPERAPEGPAAIAASPDSPEVFVLDSVNQRIVRVLPSARPLPAFAIPDADYPADLVVRGRSFYVLDSAGRAVLKYAADGRLEASYPVKDPAVELTGAASLVVLPNEDIRIRRDGAGEVLVGPAARGDSAPESGISVPTPQGTVTSRFERGGESSARVALAGAGRSADAPAALDVNSQEFLASADLVAVDSKGRYYVLAEELSPSQPGFAVHTALARYSAQGKLETVADIPVAEVIALPNRYVAVTREGKAYFLQPTEREVRVVDLAFVERDGLSVRNARLGLGREAPPVSSGDFEKAVRTEYAGEITGAARGPISRQKILENARRYLDFDWVLKPQNYQHAGLSAQCAPPGSKWKRPDRLSGKMNQQVRAVPYRWGGFDSLALFRDRLDEGYLAGDVCTCRKAEYGFCITAKSTGVDCSGFVSRTLEEKYYTTSSLHRITERLRSFRDLRPGDILNRAGSHVRLFVGFSEQGPLRLKTIESAVSCGGVCAASYTVSQLSRYAPLRYKNVQN
jgi:hypothetical protein